MALQCPQCSNPIEADFGVVTCSHCQSVLFIDMEGQIQLSEPPSVSPLMESQPEATSQPADFGFQEYQDSWMQDQGLPSADEPPETVASGTETRFEPPFQQEEALIHQGLPDGQEFQPPIDEIQAPSFEESPFEDAVPAQDPNDLSDISEYSNADQAYGPLSYSVIIEEIDTKEIRQQLADALDDPKFQWDARELLKKIKLGRLQLENLNPVKASVLVHRLQSVPVKVSWTQNVFS